MKVVFRSNLDCFKNEHWPTITDYRPVVGDRVRSTVVWLLGFQLELIIVSTTITQDGLVCELHLDPKQYSSIDDFYKRVYQPATGRKYI